MNNSKESIYNITDYPLATLLIDKDLNCLAYSKEWQNITDFDTTINDSLWINNIFPEDLSKIENLKIYSGAKVSNKIRIYNSLKACYLWYNYYFSFNVESQTFIIVFSPIQKEKDIIDNYSTREKRFKNIFDFAPDAIIILNNVGQVINCNRAFYELTGLASNEILNKKFYELPHKITYNPLTLISLFQQLKKGVIPEVFEITWTNKSNVEHISEIHISLLNKIQNKVEIQAIIRDITYRKYTEKKVIESEENHRMLFETMSSGVALFEFVNDKQNKPCDIKYLSVNNSYEELIGINRVDLIGKTYSEIFKKLEYFWFDNFKKVAFTGTSNRVEGFVSIFQKYFDVLIYSPKIGQFAVIYYDIHERTIAQIEANKSRERAEAADKLKSSFLANMSHEIRTPMNGIIGFSKLLKKEDLQPEQKEKFINIIDGNCSILLKLIDDILDISRIEAGELVIEFTQVNIELILYEILAFYEIYKDDRNKSEIELKLNIQKGLNLKGVVTDKIRLKQIISNLIGNALKFTEKGFIEFGVSKYGRNFLQFYVKDSGIGISKEHIEKVFDRFWTHELSASKKYDGTGLGLAICNKLSNLLGGKIWVESEVDKGSTFYFTIPLKYDNNNEDSILHDELLTDVDWSNKNVLIVEDDYASYLFLDELLSESGINIMHATNGAEAVDLFRSNDFQIVLMDIQMPIMDGLTATKEMKKINPNVPIIAQTVLVFNDDRNKCFEVGCDDVISKPIDPQRLIKTMKKFILA
ncbi:MAG: hypothetical protein A2033_04885 [Bacteroidetes bacterium GWA2_31_9]|nr:MAG: hypothetical protein A2033_04885 [Bacteroidetes bacterium GWA2_31_9]